MPDSSEAVKNKLLVVLWGWGSLFCGAGQVGGGGWGGVGGGGGRGLGCWQLKATAQTLPAVLNPYKKGRVGGGGGLLGTRLGAVGRQRPTQTAGAFVEQREAV